MSCQVFFIGPYLPVGLHSGSGTVLPRSISPLASDTPFIRLSQLQLTSQRRHLENSSKGSIFTHGTYLVSTWLSYPHLVSVFWLLIRVKPTNNSLTWNRNWAVAFHRIRSASVNNVLNSDCPHLQQPFRTWARRANKDCTKERLSTQPWLVIDSAWCQNVTVEIGWPPISIALHTHWTMVELHLYCGNSDIMLQRYNPSEQQTSTNTKISVWTFMSLYGILPCFVSIWSPT
jgi:hypothetical protein